MNRFRVLFDACVSSGYTPYESKEYESYSEASSVLMEIAIYTLHLHDRDLMEEYSNYGVVQQFIENEWEDME